jgi:hypothetical protein
VDEDLGCLLDFRVGQDLLLESLVDILCLGLYKADSTGIKGHSIFACMILCLLLVHSEEDRGHVAQLAALVEELPVGYVLCSTVEPVGDDNKHAVAVGGLVGLLQREEKVLAAANQEETIVPLEAEGTLGLEFLVEWLERLLGDGDLAVHCRLGRNVAVVADLAQVLLNVQSVFDVLEYAKVGVQEAPERVRSKVGAGPQLLVTSPLVKGEAHDHQLVVETTVKQVTEVLLALGLATT